MSYDPENIFAKILRNEIDEEFRIVQKQLKVTSSHTRGTTLWFVTSSTSV